MKRFIGFIFAFILGLILVSASAQTKYTIKGVVKDTTANEPIPYASIYVVGSKSGVVASVNGSFTIPTNNKTVKLKVQAVGYTTKEVKVNSKTDSLVIYLESSSQTLAEVVVKKHREKYVKKGNPAVEFIEKVRAHMHDRDPFNHQYFTYDKYEQMTYGLNDLTRSDTKDLAKSFNKVKEFIDTLETTGKKVLPVSLNEKYSTEFFRKSPSTHKEYVTAQHHVGLDEAFDAASIKRFMDDAFHEIDIFSNDIKFLQNRFVSPLSNIGTSFYKYYLNDTIEVDGEKCIELDFVPFNSQSFGFIGRMYFPLNDTTMFIKKISMNVPKSINVNYVQHVYINQEFTKAEDGSRLKTRDDMVLEFKVISSQGLYARRNTYYKNHNFDVPSDMSIFSKDAEVIVAPDANKVDDDYFADIRPQKLNNDGNSMKALMKRLRTSKFFYWAEKTVVTLFAGYVATGNPSKFDFGPLNTFLSGDALEGFRVRFGGMSTANLSKHWFNRWYAAYGFSDKKWKYGAELEYSFNEKKYHNNEFPIHSLKLSHLYDVDKLGQHYMYTSQDNVFLLLKRQKDDKINYLRQTKFEYKLETSSGFSVSAGFEHDIHEASKYLPFVDADGNVAKSYREAGFNVTLRYAPGEKFYQTRNYRFPINIDNPIITLSHTYLPKGFLGSDFEVNKTELGIQKRFWFSAWGYTDVIVKAAKIWSKVAYPDLLIPNANLSYTIQYESYALMNAMEFANDQYVSWDVTYWLNGALLNYVPLLKKLKLREVVSFRGLYGSLSDKNNPLKDGSLYQFPEGTNCQGMGKKPYMELGVGLDNIFKFLRLDYVWRLTYRDTPGVDKSGLRLQLHFTF